MKKRKYAYLKPTDIKPEGWLKKQLRLQAEGLSGHLDLIWPDIQNSRWIGGDRDGWERVPYWLDGFVPLAWLLEDEELKARAKRYIDGILEGQQEDGWICPCALEERDRYDVWAVFLVCKVLAVYGECSGDGRVEQAVYDALKQLLSHISSKTLFGWGAARWFECMIPLLWLYERRPEPWMEELAYVLEGCGIDYEKLYARLSFEKPKVRSYWTFLNHVVNVAMALKSRAEMSLFTGEDPNAFAMDFYRKLTEKHGMAIGHFTGDECLSGTSPIQGSECCGIVEAMYSYEELLSIGGDPVWGDLLEQTAFNGLAATVSADMWTHQYVQMTNQVECSRVPEGKAPFNSNGGDAHTFGLEPNFGCCTANFSQGWPKFALSSIMRTEDGLAAVRRGPLFYALPINAKYERIEYERDGVIRKFPYCDYAITPESDWGFGFGGGEAKTVYGDFPEMPFDREKPSVMLEMEMVPISWKKEDGICARLPESVEPVGQPVVKRLYPYGCTTLRMTEMPMITGVCGS